MLTPILFNNELSAWGTEIHNVIPDGMLIPKMDISHAMRAQM
jgi:hypothetical protein